MQNPFEIESEMSYMNQPYEECLGHSTPLHDQTLEPRVDEINHNFDAAVQEQEVQPPRREEKFSPTQQPPTCVMVEGDTATNLVNENYELMKKLQKKGRKPELFDMLTKIIVNKRQWIIFDGDVDQRDVNNAMRKMSLIDLEKNFNQDRFNGRIFSLTGRQTSAPGYRCAVCHPEDRFFYGLRGKEDDRRQIHHHHNIRSGGDRRGVVVAPKHPVQMNIFRRVVIFFSLINYVLVFALVLTGLVTDYWISTSSLERNGKVLSSSFIHGGLFYGERQLDWGLGPSHQYFSGKLLCFL
uniref:Uncharacterized protein n=1 Tax=Panagrolaimus sp. PS1159 TaxID=55785 RepID=A0AC35ETG7_9BILA